MRETVSWIGLIFLYLSLGGVKPDYDDDSLQAAINAVSQRRRNIAQLHEYDPDEDGSSQSEPLAYLDLPTGDVRLEGPGYNYQMLMSQMRGPSGPYAKDDFESSQSAKDRSLEEALSEYIGNVSPDDIIELKRSAFRELADQPDNLQRLAGPRGGEEGSVMTSFRERAKPTSYEDEFRRHPSNHRDRSNVGGGGGGGGEEQSEEDLKEYFDALNTYLQYNLPLELQKSYKESVKEFLRIPMRSASRSSRLIGTEVPLQQ